MKKFWSSRIRGIVPYTPGEQPKDIKLIKLNTNENPYPPSPAVIGAVSEAASALRLYPDPNCTALCEAVSEVYGVKVSQVFPGNGSDEILALAFLAFYEPAKAIKFPVITYDFYPVYADLFQVPYELVPLKDDFSIPVDKLENSEGGVILANPNAPTGIALSLAEVERVLRTNPDTVVMLDEAYVEFGAESAVTLIDRYPNLLVVRTASKAYSLAGLRVGFAMGGENLISALNAVKNSFNSYTLDRAAINGSAAALRDRAYFERCRDAVISTREWVSTQMRELGFYVTDSRANFLFASHERVFAADIFAKLRERGILVRYWNKPGISNFLRITIGTDDDMRELVKALREITAA